MKIVLIDDETDARMVLRKMLAVYCPEAVISGEADGVQTGVQQIRHEKPSVSRLSFCKKPSVSRALDTDGFLKK